MTWNPRISQVAIYSQGIAHNFWLMVGLGLAGSLTILVGLRYTLVSPLFTPLDSLIFLVGLCVYVPCTILLFIVPKRYFYHVLMPWVGAAAFVGAALSLHSMFGVNASRLLNDQIPVFLAFIPVVIVFAYTYLTTGHALIVCGGYSLILATGAAAFAVSNWPASMESTSAIFLLLTLWVANPAVIGMMHLTRSLQLRVSSLLEQAIERERKNQLVSWQSQHTDAVTLVLNRAGALERIGQQLARDSGADNPLQVYAVMADGSEAVESTLRSADRGRILQRMSRLLGDALDPGAEVARLGGTHFLLWSHLHAGKNRLKTAGELLRHLHNSDIGNAAGMSFSVGIATAAPGDTAEALIEAANFQLFLAQSRGGGQISVLSESARLTAAHERGNG